MPIDSTYVFISVFYLA